MFIKREFQGEMDFFKWEKIEAQTYLQNELSGITRQTLIDFADEKASFEVRYYHFDKGSMGDYARHNREYFFYILHGYGQIKINDDLINVNPNDFVYLSPNELVQIIPQTNKSFGFLCVTNAQTIEKK